MEHQKTYVTLHITSSSIGPEEVTRVLDIEPSESHRAGEIKLVGPETGTQAKVTIEFNTWSLASGKSVEATLGEHLDSILKKLVDRREELASLADSHTAELSIAHYYYGANPGLHFSNEHLRLIAEYGFELDLDIYCLGDE